MEDVHLCPLVELRLTAGGHPPVTGASRPSGVIANLRDFLDKVNFQ